MNPREWPTLLIIDTPDGGRVFLPCRTPATVRSNESILIFDSEGDWHTSAGAAFWLRLRGSTTVKNPFNSIIDGVPWIVYCEAVPREAPRGGDHA